MSRFLILSLLVTTFVICITAFPLDDEELAARVKRGAKKMRGGGTLVGPIFSKTPGKAGVTYAVVIDNVDSNDRKRLMGKWDRAIIRAMNKQLNTGRARSKRNENVVEAPVPVPAFAPAVAAAEEKLSW